MKHTKPYIIQTPHCRHSCFKNYTEDAITSSTLSLSLSVSLVDCIPKDKIAATEPPYFPGSFHHTLYPTGMYSSSTIGCHHAIESLSKQRVSGSIYLSFRSFMMLFTSKCVYTQSNACNICSNSDVPPLQCLLCNIHFPYMFSETLII